MTIFNNLDIQTTKNYDNLKTVRRNVSLTPRHALAIEELKVLYESETKGQAYTSDIINWAISCLIDSINNDAGSDGQIELIINGIDGQ